MTSSTVEMSATSEAFDLKSASIPNFTTLVQARSTVFRSRSAVDSFSRMVDGLSNAGEEGRRKGLGQWMVARYEACAAQLASYEKTDVVAAFTRGSALMSIGRWADAHAIFERLSGQYPEEPRPRGNKLEAQLELDLHKGDHDAAANTLQRELDSAPPSFAASAEHSYLKGRLAELRRSPESALDLYAAAREIDPSHRTNLARFASLAERCGLDELALQAYQSLASMLPIDRNVMFNLGVLYEDLGRDQEAAACYDIIARNDPTNLRARLYLEDARSGIDMYYDEDLERKEDRLNQILKTPITDFELSVRARNCLNKMNIVTLGDLVRLTEQELLSYKNFGETSLNEIKDILNSKGLRLGMKHEEAVASIEAAARPRAGSNESSEVLNTPVSKLDLSIRVRRAVENLACLTLGDILAHSEDELLSMPNFGQTSLLELKRKLAEFGLQLQATKKK